MEYSGFFNANFDAESGTYDREYSANDFAAFFSSFVGDGIYSGLDATAGNYKVTVNSGSAMIKGYMYRNDASIIFDIAQVDTVGKSRIDYVVISLSEANREIVAKVISGAESVSPVPPTIGDTDLLVAEVTVTNGSSTLELVDKRTYINTAELAERLAAAESKLVKDWQPLGQTTGSTPLIIPSGAKELAAIIYVNNNKAQSLVFNIPLDLFDAGTAYCFSTGFYQNASSFYSAEVQIEGNNFLMSKVYNNENTNNRRINSTMKVMWR